MAYHVIVIVFCRAKDLETTSAALGYRVSGMQVHKNNPQLCLKKYDEECTSFESQWWNLELVFAKVYEAKIGEVWKASREWCKFLKPEEVPDALKRFVSSNPSAEEGWDGAAAKHVYGTTLTELEKLKAWYATPSSSNACYLQCSKLFQSHFSCTC